MDKYPSIKDKDFYTKISEIYKRFEIPKRKKSFKEICFPKKYELQLPQKFMENFINPNTPYKGILVYHRIGAGKTCTGIRIAETWKKIKKIIVVLPASLKGNFRNELRTLCADNNYLKADERERLKKLTPHDTEYKKIMEKSNARIDEYYKIYSYNKFIELAQENKINLKNSILIIDEVQNMVSEGGTFYKQLYDLIHKAPKDLRVVLLSATPMFDKPNEIALTMNLLRLENEMPTGKEFNKMFISTKKRHGELEFKTKNMSLFKKYLKGYVSFFRGAPAYVYPKLIIRYVNCVMSDFQYKAYKDVLEREKEKFIQRNKIKNKKVHKRKNYLNDYNLTVKNLPNNFFIGTRIVSNVVFPNRIIGENGLESFKGSKITKDLEMYSTKFYKIINKVMRSYGKIFIYSGFTEFGGIKSLCRVLDTFGFSDYMKTGSGKKRYAVWSGNETQQEKDEIRSVYNNPNNLLGQKIKIFIGSSAAKEGLSLTAVRQVHILEPYWNQARLEQVIGRASRFCSHKDVDEEKRVCKVYIYIAVFPEDRPEAEKKIYKESVDQHIHHLAEQKNKLIKEFEKAIIEASIDCELNKNSTVAEGDDEDIVCEK